MKYLFYIIGIVVLFGAGFITRMVLTPPEDPINNDTVVVYRRDTIRDTVIVERIRKIPKYDTVTVYCKGDTIEVPVLLEFAEKEVRGDNYRALLYGYQPELRWIEVFPETKTQVISRTQVVYQRPTWEAGVVAGAAFYRGGADEYIGVRVRYNKGALSAEAVGAYNPFNKRPYGELRVGVDIWKK